MQERPSSQEEMVSVKESGVHNARTLLYKILECFDAQGYKALVANKRLELIEKYNYNQVVIDFCVATEAGGCFAHTPKQRLNALERFDRWCWTNLSDSPKYQANTKFNTRKRNELKKSLHLPKVWRDVHAW